VAEEGRHAIYGLLPFLQDRIREGVYIVRWRAL